MHKSSQDSHSLQCEKEKDLQDLQLLHKQNREVTEADLREEQTAFRPIRLCQLHFCSKKIWESVQKQNPHATSTRSFKKNLPTYAAIDSVPSCH